MAVRTPAAVRSGLRLDAFPVQFVLGYAALAAWLLFGEALLHHVFHGRPEDVAPLVRNTCLLAVPVVGAVASWIAVLTGRLAWSTALAAALVAVLAAVHYHKVVYLGQPLYFADRLVLVEGLRATGQMTGGPVLPSMFAALLLLGIAFAWRKAGDARSRLPWKRRAQLAATWTLLAAAAASFPRLPPEDLSPRFSFTTNGVMRLGLVPFLVASAWQGFELPMPDGYSREAVSAIRSRYPEAPPPAPATGVRPDVVFYGIESLMDYAALDVRYAEDPMPFFSRLRRESGSHCLVSPTVGGRTIQPEFELLTGLSAYPVFIPNPMAYVNSTLRPFPSACTALAPLGYRCIGLNSTHTDNFRRDLAYRRFGFDSFDGVETLVEGKLVLRMPNGTVPDHILVNEFLARLPAGAPVFAYLMTNATHADYGKWPRPAAYRPQRNDLPVATLDTLQSDGSALHHADQALESLVTAYRKSGRPVVLVAFGDHLPARFDTVLADLGATHAADWNLLGAYRTPLAVWTQGVNLDWSTGAPGPMVSPNLLLAELAPRFFPDWRPPLQFRIAARLAKEWMALSCVGVDRNGRTADRRGIEAEAVRDYEMIEYDLLGGERYSLASTEH